jgi:glycerol-3-phosphate acyltransferase PlsY
MEIVRALLLLLLCYAIGGLSPAWLAVKWLGKKDLRHCGSGTLGATNAGRVLGRGAYVVIALLDILKGWAAVLPVSIACNESFACIRRRLSFHYQKATSIAQSNSKFLTTP